MSRITQVAIAVAGILAVVGVAVVVLVPRTVGTDSQPIPKATVTGTFFQTPESDMAASEEEWPTEVFSDKATAVLNQFKAAGTMEELVKQSAECFTNDFTLIVPPESARTSWPSSTARVTRTGREVAGESLEQSGPDAARRFVALLRPAGDSSNCEVRLLKIVSVELGEPIRTTVRCESFARRSENYAQLVQTWHCEWKTSTGGSPRLATARLVSEDTAERTGGPLFIDRTTSVIGASTAFQTQLRFGLQHWLARIETAHGMNYFSKHGLAVADVNGDGRDDLFVCQPAGLPNRLFLQLEDGTAVDASAQFELDLLDRTSAAVFVDLDNDGDQDLALATITGVQVLENDKNARFIHRLGIRLPDIDLQGISAVDYDNDGDLDLYQIVDYASDSSRSREGLPSFVYHNANDGGSNRLLRNDIRGRHWVFSDVTNQVGLSQNNHRHSLAAAWQDYDDDGDLDLYVANDYGQNCLYRNDGGRFTDVASLAGVTDFGSGMSVAWGDYDRDAKVDLYVSNMFSSAGNRITSQEQFLPNLSDQGKLLYKRFAKGNSLFRNTGEGRFEETGARLNVEIARWAWGSLFADIDNDGWDDLAVANGYITTSDSGDL